MRNPIKVKPNVHRLMTFMARIEEGQFKIPTFQRDFIWEDKEKIELFDSISKEYPIGSILLWQPKDKFANQQQIGPFTMNHSENVNYFYVLDGFQRLSTLFGCLTNPNKTALTVDEEKLKKSFSMFYSLEEESFKMKKATSNKDIPVYKLIDTYEFLDFIDDLRTELKGDPNINQYIERAKKLSSTIIDYQIPSIEVEGGTIKDAIEIFSRVNSKGIDISPDWMLSALTSNEEKDFNLGMLLGALLEELKEYNFEKTKRELLVQCIQNSFGEIYFDQTIEDLANRSDFQDVTVKAITSIKKAVKFLFEELLVVDKKLLPYNYQLIFLTHFFNKIESPNDLQKEKLKRWFWITTYSNYFTIYNLSKMRQAFKQFKSFTLNESEDPVYYDQTNRKFITADIPASVSLGSVRSKAFLLFLLNWSDNFCAINSSDIDSYKTLFLYKGKRNHSSLFPVLVYTKQSKIDLPFSFSKSKEMASLLEGKIDGFKRNYFLNERMIELHKSDSYDLVCSERITLIEVEEGKFVENLGITYSNLTGDKKNYTWL